MRTATRRVRGVLNAVRMDGYALINAGRKYIVTPTSKLFEAIIPTIQVLMNNMYGLNTYIIAYDGKLSLLIIPANRTSMKEMMTYLKNALNLIQE